MMIIEPDFLDHWKTRLLIERTKDEAAPLMLLRLWGYCQQRKNWRFKNLNGEILAAICRSKIDGNLLQSFFQECGFLHSNGNLTVVHDWEKSNAQLVSAWKNGTKGGRPKKPVGSIGLTEGKPKGNPTKPSHLSNLSYLSVLKEGVVNRFKDWVQVRKAMGKKPKNWDSMFLEQAEWLSQFTQADQIESLSASIRNNWQGLFPPKRDKASSKAGPIVPKESRPIREPTDEEFAKQREIIAREKARLKLRS